MEKIHEAIRQSISVKEAMLADSGLIKRINQAIELILKTYRSGGKVFFCGNGGSAADAQHLAAEFSGRYYLDREPLFSEALHVNTSYLTAVSNDYGFDEAYARLVRAFTTKGDTLVSLSTSGNSLNILKAIEEARARKVYVIGLTGQSGGKMASACDVLINVPSTDTPRIQEAHITIGHILCELVEKKLFNK